jgi:2-iminoacetate synthase
VQAGAESLVVYQESYNRERYAELHTFGPKKDFDWRLACPERAYAAGFRRIGIGALFGLWKWQEEAVALAAHLEYLQKRCWKSQITVSMPRLRPAAGEYEPEYPLPDREFVQVLCALRICFPQTGIVLSTRESPKFRDGLIPLGVTMISAGSKTEPGGYTGAGREALHQTVRGRAVPLENKENAEATVQFVISDARSTAEMVDNLRRNGIEAVWKDWDHRIASSSAS